MRFVLRNADIILVAFFMIGLALVLAFLPNPTALDDSLRHLAMGRMMLEKGILHAYWSSMLFWGTMSGLRTDPWFLYDVMMMQFARFPNLVALDLNVFFSVSVLALAGFAAFRSLGLKGLSAAIFLWLLLMGDQQFFARMMIGRPFTIQTAIGIGVIACVWKRQYVIQAILLALSVLVSQLFIFPLFFSMIGIVWTSIADSKKHASYLALSTTIGLVAGFALHPYPDQYLRYLASVFLEIPFLTNHVQLSKEMNFSFSDISMTAVLVAVGAIVLLMTLMLRKQSCRSFVQSSASYPFFLFVLLLPVYLTWVRAIDLLWPILILTIASLFLIIHKDAVTFIQLMWKYRGSKILIIVLVICQTIALPAWFFVYDSTRNLDDFSAAVAIPDHAKVLDLDWTQFPVLSMMQQHARYATGIDPSFLYLSNARIYESINALQHETLSDDEIGSLISYLLRKSDACIIIVPASWPMHVRSVIEQMPEINILAGSKAFVIGQVGPCTD